MGADEEEAYEKSKNIEKLNDDDIEGEEDQLGISGSVDVVRVVQSEADHDGDVVGDIDVGFGGLMLYGKFSF